LGGSICEVEKIARRQMKINFRDVKIAVRTLVDALSLEQYKKRAPSR